MLISNVKNILLLLFSFIIFYIFFLNFNIYIGQKKYYILFTIVSIFYLFYNLYNFRNFFHFFLSFFIFLGFWFKFSFNSIYNHYSLKNSNYYAEASDLFNFTPNNIDNVIIISTVAIVGMMVSNFFKKFNIKIQYNRIIQKINLLEIFVIIFFFIFIFSTNIIYEIYLKGLYNNNLNYLIYIFYAFIYQVGGLFLLGYLCDCHIVNEKYDNYKYIILFTLIAMLLISNISRNILLFLPFCYVAFLKLLEKNYMLKLKSMFIFAITLLLIVFIFTFSHLVRIEKYHNYKMQLSTQKVYYELYHFIKNRFVGIDALMSVYSVKDKNFNTYLDSWKKKDLPGNKSFFQNLLKENIKKNNIKNSNFQTVPGIIAHLFYSNSISFVFFSCLLIAFLFSYLEMIMSRYYNCENVLAIFSFIVVYRLIHFGHNPKNTVMLVFAIFVSIICLKFYEYLKKKF